MYYLCEMKVEELKSVLVKNFRIDYENGVTCEYTTRNGRLRKGSYVFLKDKKRFSIIENIEEVIKVSWFEFHDVMKVRNITKVSDLKNFTDFDKLYTREQETFLQDINGEFQDTIIYLSDLFFSIYCNVKRKSDVDDMKKRLEPIDDIFDVEDVEIPYYNGGGDTIKAKMQVSSEIITKEIKKTKRNYLDDYAKIRIIENLLNDGKKLRVPDYEVEDDDDDGDDNCYCTCY